MADLPEETRAEIGKLLAQALQELQLAAQHAATAAEYEEQRRAAPERIRAVQEELETVTVTGTGQVPPDASLDTLNQQLTQLEADLQAARQVTIDLEDERAARTNRRVEASRTLAELREELAGLARHVEAPEELEAAPALLQARQVLAQARRQALELEIRACEQELLSYEARGDLLKARIDLADARVAQLERAVEVWRAAAQERRRAEAEQAVLQAQEQVARAHPALRALATENAQLAEERDRVTRQLAQVTEQTAAVDQLLSRVREDFERISRRADRNLTNAVGQLLRKQRMQLPRARVHERNVRQRRDEIAAVQLAMMELSERRRDLGPVDAAAAGILHELPPESPARERELIARQAREALRTRQEYLDALLDYYDSYFIALVELDARERQLIERVREFTQFVDAKVLWIQSAPPLGPVDLRKAREALGWLAQPAPWRSVLDAAGGTLRTRPLVFGLAAAGVLTWLALRPRLRRVLRRTGELAARPATDRMRLTGEALLATAGLALAWPALLWLAAWVLSTPYDASEFAKALAAGLRAAALVLLTIQALRALARSDGLTAQHFRWRERPQRLLRRNAVWLATVLVPAFFLFTLLDAQSSEPRKESLGRAAFIVAFVAAALFVQRVLHPGRGLLAETLASDRAGWLHRLRYLWYPLGVALPLMLAVAAAVGYYATALYLGWRLGATVWLLLALGLLSGLVRRWLLLQVRRRALQEARERAAARAAQPRADGQPGGTDSPAPPLEEPKVAVADIGEQTRRLVRALLVVAGLVGAWLIWAGVLPALAFLNEQVLWGQPPDAVTLARLLLAVLILSVTVVAARNIPGLLEITVLEHLPLAPSGRFAAATLTRYAISVIGIIATSDALGVRWEQVQWLVAAMTVGLGFGLQEIFANFVSGLIILFERPIRVGDAVTIGDVSGVVSRIRIRATTITNWDRKELIVPNKRFITGEVLNWTLSDSILRIVFRIGVAYGSDVTAARELLLKLARQHPAVLADPPPAVGFMGFGPSSLDLELWAFVRREDYLRVMNDLNTAIVDELHRAGIEIPFPTTQAVIRLSRQELRDAVRLLRAVPEPPPGGPPAPAARGPTADAPRNSGLVIGTGEPPR